MASPTAEIGANLLGEAAHPRTHDAYHAGEMTMIQGIHGRPQTDLWPPNHHTVEAAGAREPR